MAPAFGSFHPTAFVWLSPAPPPRPHHHLSLTSPSISLLLIHSLVGFLYILIFFLCFFSFPPRLSSLCHDPLKPSAAAEELLCCVSRGGTTGAVLADVSTTEVKGRKIKTKKLVLLLSIVASFNTTTQSCYISTTSNISLPT